MNPSQTYVAELTNVSLHYGATQALHNVSLTIPVGMMVGLIGPDGVGKSSLLSLISGARAIQQGSVFVLNGDMKQKAHRDTICPRIAYIPQGLGKNLYPTLSIEENLQFFARLFGHDATERRQRIDDLTQRTGLYPFLSRPAGKLSGGMKQKLGLCCALIHDPDFLILDEPTTGVDPLARSQFWALIARVRQTHPQMSVIVATAYMDEAQRFDWLIAMDAGSILTTATPQTILENTQSASLEEAFIKLLPEAKQHEHITVQITPFNYHQQHDTAIEARDLTCRFGKFTAVDHVNFKIQQGEIFGFLGSNGCGKTTTMKMLTGLLPATEGQAWLFGQPVQAENIASRRKVGYMSQSFSLYSELTVKQNLVLHAQLFKVDEKLIPERVNDMLIRFGLTDVPNQLPMSLPLGVRQRLSLAVAMVHKPELLILDEPTSGVDPIARDNFWHLMIELARRDKVTIFISTHFMSEAERCDRISLMHAGKVLDSDSPQHLIEKKGVKTLEQAFIQYLLDAGAGTSPQAEQQHTDILIHHPSSAIKPPSSFSIRLSRLLSYMWREGLELKRDPVRATLALIGSLILMIVMSFGISMDVEELRFAVLDHDQSGMSQNYTLTLSGSRYFIEMPTLESDHDLDQRMRSGEISFALEIPPYFGQKILRGDNVEIGVWIDGAMPTRAETIHGYILGMHANWLTQQAEQRSGISPVNVNLTETRFRYNPDVRSLPAMVPAVIPILLLMLPAMLAALSVVREKELGSITNLYVTPVTRGEFLLGKQIPYVILAMLNFFLMLALAIFIFKVPLKGSVLTLTFATLLYVIISTGLGLFVSTFIRSQVAALFLTMIGTMLPAIQFSGMINTVSSLEGVGRIIGEMYPTTYMLMISRGVFSKALSLYDLYGAFIALIIAIPIILGASIYLLKKQDT